MFITDALELQVPKYILPQDNFTVTCRASKPLRVTVMHCNIISKSFQLEKDGGSIWSFVVAHVVNKKECKVMCISDKERLIKKVPVIGKDIVTDNSS